MTTANGNGRLSRPALSSQIDRLDGILDGLAEALNESVADAVRDVVGQVVRQTVEASIKEVLGSPELLRAALSRHTEPVQEPQSRRTLKQVLRSALGRLCMATTRVRKSLKTVKAWGLDAIGSACQVTRRATSRVVAISRVTWRFRKTCSVALAVGVACGVGTYLSGPVIAGMASGISSATLAVAAMVLLPLWRLLTSSGRLT